MHHTRSLTGALAAAALGLTVLAGCGTEDGSAADDPSPTDDTSTTSTTSAPTDEPTTPAPELPSPADPPVPADPADPAKEQAGAFVRRWYAELVLMRASGDTARFEKVSAGCRGCGPLVREVSSLYAAGGDISPGATTITGLTQVAGDDDVKIYDVEAEAEPGVVTQGGGEPEAVPATSTYVQVSIKRDKSGAWTVVRFLSE